MFLNPTTAHINQDLFEIIFRRDASTKFSKHFTGKQEVSSFNLIMPSETRADLEDYNKNTL